MSYSSYFFLKWVTDVASKYVSAINPARIALNPVYGVGRNIPDNSIISPGATCNNENDYRLKG